MRALICVSAWIALAGCANQARLPPPAAAAPPDLSSCKTCSPKSPTTTEGSTAQCWLHPTSGQPSCANLTITVFKDTNTSKCFAYFPYDLLLVADMDKAATGDRVSWKIVNDTGNADLHQFDSNGIVFASTHDNIDRPGLSLNASVFSFTKLAYKDMKARYKFDVNIYRNDDVTDKCVYADPIIGNG